MPAFSTIYGEVGANFSTTDLVRVKTWCNLAYHEILSARSWSFTESQPAVVALVAGTATFTLAGTSPVVPDFNGLIDVMLELTAGGARVPLWELDTQDFDAITAHATTNADPTMYCVQGGIPATTSATIVAGGQQQLKISPPPIATAGHGQNLIIKYYRNVGSVELVADTDIPILPVSQHELIIMGANYFGMMSRNQTYEANSWRAMFEGRLARAMQDDDKMRNRDARHLMRRPMIATPNQAPLSPPVYNPAARPLDAE